MWHLEEDRSLRKAWRTEVEATSTDWVTSVVDAGSGVVLEQDSRYSHAGPEGNVITEQHPDVTATREVVPLSGIDGSWVSGTTTSGNNVNAYRDCDDDDANDYQPSAADQHFNYAFTDAWRTTADRTEPRPRPTPTTTLSSRRCSTSSTTSTTGSTDAASTSRPATSRSTTSVAVAREATQSSPRRRTIQLHCPDANPPANESPADRCKNNANLGAGADGSPAHADVHVDPGFPFRDGSMDGDVIAHEYGHGVSNRLVPGGLSGATDQSGSLGEGWSDTISFLRWGDATVGEYVTGNTNGGIRSEDYDEHTDTYGDYSTGVDSPHRNGEIWAATMYDLRTALGLNDATIRLILDGMRSTPNGPNPTVPRRQDRDHGGGPGRQRAMPATASCGRCSRAGGTGRRCRLQRDARRADRRRLGAHGVPAPPTGRSLHDTEGSNVTPTDRGGPREVHPRCRQRHTLRMGPRR